MKAENQEQTKFLTGLKNEEFCYLTTTGRKSGNPHEIEIWFGIQGKSLYLLSGGGDDSDWVRNLRANPNVTLKIAKYNFRGSARIVNEKKEELMARHMLAGKYQGWKVGRSLSDWTMTALVVAIDLSEGE